jgi:hypothetical protein
MIRLVLVLAYDMHVIHIRCRRTIILDICWIAFKIVLEVEGNIATFCTEENTTIGSQPLPSAVILHNIYFGVLVKLFWYKLPTACT